MMSEMIVKIDRTSLSKDDNFIEFLDRSINILFRVHNSHEQSARQKAILNKEFIIFQFRNAKKDFENRLSQMKKRIMKQMLNTKNKINEKTVQIEKKMKNDLTKMKKNTFQITDIRVKLENVERIARNNRLNRLHQFISFIKILIKIDDHDEFQ
jgi:predicted N-acyltransferase